MRSSAHRVPLLSTLLLAALFVVGCGASEPPTQRTVDRLFTEAKWRPVGGSRAQRSATLRRIPSRLSEVVTVPRNGVLYWQHTVIDRRAGREVDVSVTVRRKGVEELAYEDRIKTGRVGFRSWREGRVDLTRWAGQTIEVIFEARYAEPLRQRRRPRDSTAPSGRIYWSSVHIASDPGSSERAPSVIFVLIDTLRADRLGVYGGERDLTPNLDALAASGTLFENAFSQANWTLPSISTIVTGLYPLRHGMTDARKRLRADAGNLARVFSRSGYLTMGYHDGGFAQGRFGFADGFDEYRRIRHLAELDIVSEWMARHRERPFFLFLHTYDVHSPYTSVPAEYWRLFIDPEVDNERVRARSRPARGAKKLDAAWLQLRSDLYAGEVRYVDDRLGELLESVNRLGLSENTLVVVTSDHGEAFGEHGSVEHGKMNLHRELIQVPLIVAGPGVARGKRVRQTVQLADLLPTFIDLLDLDGPSEEDLDGRSFAPALSGSDADMADDGKGMARVAWSEKDELWSLRSDRWTMIEQLDGETRLFDRLEDPEELHDVADEFPEVVAEHREMLRRVLNDDRKKRQAVDAELGEGLRKELEALGYLN